MKKIYVCSPLSGDIKKNIERAKEYSKFVVKQGHIPITPHIYFTQFLDDNNKSERSIGLLMGLELMEICDELWVFGKVISQGMRKEIGLFKKEIKIW